MYNGYEFYFKDGSDVLTFPITPSELSIKVGSNNKTVTLIDEGDINILKSPSLIEVEFDARFPMRKYPYSRRVSSFKTYFDKLKELKENKTPFRFIVARATPGGERTWDTNIQVALEDIELQENADEGDDVIVSIKLKQYKDFGVKILKKATATTSTSTTKREEKNTDTNQYYVVKKGDCLWTISKKFYGDALKWKNIYEANKSVIEKTAREYGKKSSSNGWWIYPGTKLTIPKL